MFHRPSGDQEDLYYFQAIEVNTETSGNYTFYSNSTIDTMGYFYRASFDPSLPLHNLITGNDDGAGQLQFRIQVAIQAGNTYILVITTNMRNVTGRFLIIAHGPAPVSFKSISITTTSRPILTCKLIICRVVQ